jgi:hypothetical protein
LASVLDLQPVDRCDRNQGALPEIHSVLSLLLMVVGELGIMPLAFLKCHWKKWCISCMQVLVYHDLLGMMSHPHHAKVTPKFCKQYAQVGQAIQVSEDSIQLLLQATVQRNS